MTPNEEQHQARRNEEQSRIKFSFDSTRSTLTLKTYGADIFIMRNMISISKHHSWRHERISNIWLFSGGIAEGVAAIK